MDNNSEVVYLYLDDIIPNRFQPREVFDDQALKELAVSIKEHGVIQPIIVRKVENKYEIIAGERRYKASTMAGLTKIPAIVKNLDDKESSKVALIENLQRKDLTPIEEARTYQKILELEDGMTQEQLAATMGKTQSSVSNKLRLLALPDEIQDALLKEKISERHARSLLNLENKNDQIKMLDRIVTDKMTVRELDKAIKEFKEGGVKEEKKEENNNTDFSAASLLNPSAINSSSDNSTNNNDLLTASDIVGEKSTEPISLNDLVIEKETTPPLATFNLASLNSDNKEKSEVKTEAPTNPPLNPSININPTVIDINRVRENSVDIGAKKEAVVEVKDLMKPPVVKEKEETDFKFVPSFDTNVSNTASTEPVQNQFSQFFNTNVDTKVESVDNSSSSFASSITTNGLTIPNTELKKDYNVAVNDIKNVVSNLVASGYKVSTEEQDGIMDYKITISLQKNA